MSQTEMGYDAGLSKALDESATDRTRTPSDTISSSESQRENARLANPNGCSRTESGVNVKAAEADFANLQRELSRISQASQKQFTRVQSRRSGKGRGEKDVEKGGISEEGTTDEGEQFDLENTLRGNHTVSFLPPATSLFSRLNRAILGGTERLKAFSCLSLL